MDLFGARKCRQSGAGRKMLNKYCLKVSGEGSEFKAKRERGRGATWALWFPVVTAT